MPAHYYNVSLDEMRSLLQPAKGWREELNPRSKEAIFQYPLRDKPEILIKVYTGIVAGGSRKVGKDAIRVAAVNVRTDKGWIKSKRVHRVENWRENLKGRILQVIRQSKARARDSVETPSMPITNSMARNAGLI